MRNQRLFDIYLSRGMTIEKGSGKERPKVCVETGERAATGGPKEYRLQGTVVSGAQGQVQVGSVQMAWDWRSEYRCDFWTVSAQK